MHHQLVFTINFWIYFFWDYQAELINLRLNSGGTCYDQLVCNGIKSEESIAISVQTRKRRERIFLGGMKRGFCLLFAIRQIYVELRPDEKMILAVTWLLMADQRPLSCQRSQHSVRSNCIAFDVDTLLSNALCAFIMLHHLFSFD